MKHTGPSNHRGVHKRSFLKLLWVALGFTALGEFIFVIISFLRPEAEKRSDSLDTMLIEAGNADDYGPGSVTAFVQGQFYLICTQEGGFLALSARCTHLGCALPWEKDKKQFICPCHASVFDFTGNVLSSPAPRAMDMYKVTIIKNIIQVDIGKKIKRNRFHKNQLVFPETVFKPNRE